MVCERTYSKSWQGLKIDPSQEVNALRIPGNAFEALIWPLNALKLRIPYLCPSPTYIPTYA
jgi:hypothetical protein